MDVWFDIQREYYLLFEQFRKISAETFVNVLVLPKENPCKFKPYLNLKNYCNLYHHSLS